MFLFQFVGLRVDEEDKFALGEKRVVTAAKTSEQKQQPVQQPPAGSCDRAGRRSEMQRLHQPISAQAAEAGSSTSAYSGRGSLKAKHPSSYEPTSASNTASDILTGTVHNLWLDSA